MNIIPSPHIDRNDIQAVLRLLAKNTLFLPVDFLAEVQAANEKQKDYLLEAHPDCNKRKKHLQKYFLPELAVAYPFVRRLIASERKGLKSWLHRYHQTAGVILDDNRMPKACWSYAWFGNKNGFAKSEDFRRYEASHLLPHKVENHESFINEVFDETPALDPNFLFLSVWNNLLVDKRLAGLTDNSPVVTAVLLHEVQRRYSFDLRFLGKLKKRVLGHTIGDLAREVKWWEEPAGFHNVWSRFADARQQWINERLTDPLKMTAEVQAKML